MFSLGVVCDIIWFHPHPIREVWMYVVRLLIQRWRRVASECAIQTKALFPTSANPRSKNPESRDFDPGRLFCLRGQFPKDSGKSLHFPTPELWFVRIITARIGRQAVLYLTPTARDVLRSDLLRIFYGRALESTSRTYVFHFLESKIDDFLPRVSNRVYGQFPCQISPAVRVHNSTRTRAHA